MLPLERLELAEVRREVVAQQRLVHGHHRADQRFGVGRPGPRLQASVPAVAVEEGDRLADPVPERGGVAEAGAVLQMIGHGLITGALFLCVGMVYERTHQRSIPKLGGLAHRLPVYATLMVFFALASLGLPGLAGFVGEFLILVGVFTASPPFAVGVAVGIVLGAAYLLWLYQRVFWGKITHEENEHLHDLNGRELATLVPLVVLCFWIGIYPTPFLNRLNTSVDRVVARREVTFSDALREKARRFRETAVRNPLRRQKIESALAADVPCPHCGYRMAARPYNYQDFVPVDKCLSCGKIWFDADELETLQILIEDRAAK